MPTQKFQWKDRDTAAQDLLQLVYHAPPSVSTSALELLKAIRSRSIIPELENIALDETLDIGERRYALRAITAVSGEVNLASFAQCMASAFVIRCNYFRQLPKGRPYYSAYSPDLLDDFLWLADKHPPNRKWFFDVVKAVDEPMVVCDYLGKSINHLLTDDFRQELFETLMSFINKSANVLTLELTRELFNFDAKKSRQVLNPYRQPILELCLESQRDHQWFSVADNWDELREELIRVKPEVATVITEVRQQRTTRQIEHQLLNQKSLRLALESAGYRLSLELYESAQKDDYDAYDRLRKIARQSKNISLQAIATHFIGQLLPKYDALAVLKHQLLFRVDQGSELFDWPFRHEAGNALMRHPSSDVWESLVDNYFIKPRNIYSKVQQNWIAYVTDILSGEQQGYQGNTWAIENSKWFYALADIDEQSLAKYTNP